MYPGKVAVSGSQQLRDGTVIELTRERLAAPLRHGDRSPNGLSPIDDFFVILLLKSGFDIPEDLFRIFFSRIV